jgi:hypothetical protein
VAPILGAAVAGFAYRWLRGEVVEARVVTTETQTVGTGAAAEEAVIRRK